VKQSVINKKVLDPDKKAYNFEFVCYWEFIHVQIILKLIIDIVNTDREFLLTYDDNLHESAKPGRLYHNTCGKGLRLCFV
jgi:hypothetical protein